MQAYELLSRFTDALAPLAFILIITSVITLTAAIVLLLFCKKVWVDKKNFKYYGLFFSLNGFQKVKLAACWEKLLVMVIFSVSFQELEACHYALFAVLGIVSIINKRGIIKWATNIISFVVQFFGLFALNTICAFIYDAGSNFMYICIYIAAAIFLILYALYLFLNEINEISEERSLIYEEN